jgi:hypothetical protein
MTIADRIKAAQNMALNGGVPMRRTDGKLYAVLGECLSICEEVLRDNLQEALRAAVRVSIDVRGQNNAGRGRKYVNSDSDVHILVARAVLQGVDSRNSFYRYALILREASARQISGADLPEWLAKNGGAKELYVHRLAKRQTRKLKILHLDRSIEYPTDGVFTLHLVYDGAGGFRVFRAE